LQYIKEVYLVSLETDINPILLVIPPWDATKGTSIYYAYTGSKQATENQMIIVDAETDVIVYNQLFRTFEKVHHVPALAIANGGTYRARLRVKLADGTFTSYSSDIEFMAFATPVVTIDNIDGQGYVYNTDVTFVATYSQSNGEKLKNYKFSLYDENEHLIENYPVRLPSLSNPNSLSETVNGLEKSNGYSIEVRIETENGMLNTYRKRFIPLYIVPSINGVVSTVADTDDGFVRITANLKQILGTKVKALDSADNSLSFDYQDEDWVVIPQHAPLIFTGLGMNRASDFMMKVWCKQIPNNTKFLELSPVGDKPIAIEFWKKSDRIIAVKKHGILNSVHVSNIISIPFSSEFMLYAKVIEHRIDLSITIL